MPGRAGRWLTALLAAALLAGPAWAQGPRTVSFTVQVIEAGNPPQSPSNDRPVPEAILRELQRTFRFKQYRLLGSLGGSTAVGTTWGQDLPGSTVRLEATPRSADAGMIAVDVKLLRGGAPVVSTMVRVAPGGQVVVGGPSTGSGSLIVVLSAR
jgi:hypothetical protein